MSTVHTSAAEYDKAMRDQSEQMNVPVPRLSGVPLSPYSDRPVLIYADQTKPAGFDYALTVPTPIRHGLDGLIAETLYSTLGTSVADTYLEPTKTWRKGTFSFWADSYTSPEGVTREGSQIAAREAARLQAARHEPYRGMNPLVFDTPRTLDRVIEAMRADADPLARVAARILAFGNSFTYSPNIVVLTRLAATRFYVPTALPVNSISTWIAAFQLPRISPPDDALAVWDRLTSTNVLPNLSSKVGDTIYKASQKALFFASIASGPFAIKANAQCEAASAAMAMLETLDPGLRGRALASGDMITGDLIAASEDDAEIVMTSPTLRIKKGDRLSLRLDDGSLRSIDVSVEKVFVDRTDTIRLDLVPAVVKKRYKDGQVVARERVWSKPELRELHHAGENRVPITLTRTLMSPNAGQMERKRWIKSTERTRVQRQMPLEVAIAAGSGR